MPHASLASSASAPANASVFTDSQFSAWVHQAMDESRPLFQHLVTSVLGQLEQRLTQALGSQERQVLNELVFKLHQTQHQLANSFATQFAAMVSGEAVAGGAPRQAVPVDFDKLALIDEDRVQEDVEVAQMIHLIESEAEWELRDLNARMMALREGLTGSARRTAPGESNFLRPEVFSRSLQRAVQSLDIDPDARVTLLKSFGRAMSAALKDTYTRYNARLEALNIRPAAFRAAARMGGPGLSGKLTGSGGEGASSADDAHTPKPQAEGSAGDSGLSSLSLEDLQRLLRGDIAPLQQGGYGGGYGAASSGAGRGIPSSFFGNALQGTPLRDALDRVAIMGAGAANGFGGLGDLMQAAGGALGHAPGAAPAGGAGGFSAQPVNVIHQFREDLLAAAQRPLEKLTIDVVALIFDHILADKRLPPRIKAAIARLQIPVLRIALHDASLFSSRQHPTRRLINRMASHSVGFELDATADDPRFAAFCNRVEEAVERITASEGESADLYERELQELDDLIARQTASVEQAAQEAVAALQRAEFRTLLRASLGKHMTSLLGGLNVAPFMTAFLKGPWTHVLVESVLRHGDDSDTTRMLRQAGSDLLWSIQPKTGRDDRQRLVKMLPGLVKLLTKAFAWIDFAPGERRQFMSDLMAAQAQAMRGADKADAQLVADYAALADKWKSLLDQAGADVSQAGETGVDLLLDDAAPDVAVTAAERATSELLDAVDIVVDAGAMEVRPGAAAEATGQPSLENPGVEQGAPPNRPLVDRLRVGHWCDVYLSGGWTRAQLFWRSPQGLFFMFSSKVAGRAHSMTRRAVERLSRDGLIRLAEDNPLLDRAVDSVLRKARQSAQTQAAGA